MKSRIYLSMLFVFILQMTLFSLDVPRIAIVPFQSIGVSENDAITVTSLFETALVKTESYLVIEQNQVKEIIDAQAFSLSGCVDDSCAIEFGELLSAEQIILGSLSTIGESFVLNAKIIDVASGKHVRADSESFSSLSEVTRAVELLAFKLAGLTMITGASRVEVASEFIELLIETEPSGADIYINGIPKGVSPDLLSRIPVGPIVVEARKDNFYAVRDIEVDSDTSQLFLSLEEQFGKLFIKSSESDVNVFLHGRELGPLDSGFFEQLPLGDFQLEVLGDFIYWSGTVEIAANITTRVDVFPRPFGVLRYHIPEGATAKIRGEDYTEMLTGSGVIPRLFPGSYSINTSGDNYISDRKNIEILKGSELTFQPELAYTPEYTAYLKEKTREADFNEFSSEIIHLRGIISMGNRVDNADIDRLEDFLNRIEESGWHFPGLFSEGDSILDTALLIKGKQDRLSELHDEKIALESEISRIESRQSLHKRGGWISAGVSAVSALASGVFYLMANTAYNEYTTAGPEDWQTLKDTYETYDTAAISALAAAALGGAVTPFLWMTGPKASETSGLNARIARITMEISEIEGALQ